MINKQQITIFTLTTLLAVVCYFSFRIYQTKTSQGHKIAVLQHELDDVRSKNIRDQQSIDKLNNWIASNADDTEKLKNAVSDFALQAKLCAKPVN